VHQCSIYISDEESVEFSYHLPVTDTNVSMHQVQQNWKDCQYEWIPQSDRILFMWAEFLDELIGMDGEGFPLSEDINSRQATKGWCIRLAPSLRFGF
jgi:hypothetical protein